METEIEFIKKIVKEANKISEKYFKVFSKNVVFSAIFNSFSGTKRGWIILPLSLFGYVKNPQKTT